MKSQNDIVHLGKTISLHPASKRIIRATDQLAIPTKNRIEIISLPQIVHLQAESNYTHLYLIDGCHFFTCKTLKSFDAILRMPAFMRIHQSHIIQTKYLKSFDAANGTVHLVGNQILPVSRARKSVLMKYLRTLMISH